MHRRQKAGMPYSSYDEGSEKVDYNPIYKTEHITHDKSKYRMPYPMKLKNETEKIKVNSYPWYKTFLLLSYFKERLRLGEKPRV